MHLSLPISAGFEALSNGWYYQKDKWFGHFSFVPIFCLWKKTKTSKNQKHLLSKGSSSDKIQCACLCTVSVVNDRCWMLDLLESKINFFQTINTVITIENHLKISLGNFLKIDFLQTGYYYLLSLFLNYYKPIFLVLKAITDKNTIYHISFLRYSAKQSNKTLFRRHGIR